MRSIYGRFFTTLFVGLSIAVASAATNAPSLAHMVRYEIGDTEFAEGDSITIEEIRGTSPTIVTGGTYAVSGRYTLSSADEADLSLFATTTDPSPKPVDAQQTIRVKRGTGTFRVVKTIAEPGYLHLTYYPAAGGSGFGGVYFGQGQWVLRDKHFSYRTQAKAANSAAPATTGDGSGKSPNQVLIEYLGNPVAAPADMDSAYSAESLQRAIHSAAAKAGITVKLVRIDGSEFPPVIGMVHAGGDLNKLKDEVNKMPAYEWSGGVSSETCMAINIVPSRAFPSASAQQIYRRLMLREAVLFDRIKDR
jgi:hypothetical protein